ncbi:MAG: hypothetical protein IT165_26610 [Bryobacterales bacterium]|nr:hypothetical protein [Bryobacterales bacterium]
MTLVLGLGVAMMIPDFGPKLILMSGLNVTVFETPGDFSARMLFSTLSMVALGIVAYCSMLRKPTTREDYLLFIGSVSFVLMLPWSAPLWQAVPQLSMLQFPFRLCGILCVVVAGLFAVALDNSLCERVTLRGRRSLLLVSLAAVTVIAGGILTWRVINKFREPETAGLALMRNVDVMFRTYVSSEHLVALAKTLGTAPDSFDVALTPFQDVLSGECSESRGSVDVKASGPRRFHISATCYGEDAAVRIGQLYSPLWRMVPLTGVFPEHMSLQPSPEGLIEVNLGTGRHDFALVFDTGWPERYGSIASLVSISIALSALAFAQFKRTAVST